jgi:hypothetical protein
MPGPAGPLERAPGLDRRRFTPVQPPLNAIRFGATSGNDWLQATQVPTFDLHTVCGWFRFKKSNHAPVSVQMCGMSLESVAPDNAGPYQLFCETTFQLDQIELHDSGQGGFLFTAPEVQAPYDWMFICSTNNAPGDTVFYWRWAWNSVLQVATGNTHPSMSGATRLIIGSDDAGGQNEFWDGDICGIKWWSAKLSPAEVDAESRQLYPVRSANLGAYYPFQDLASMLTDASGNGATLTNPSGTGSWTLRNDGPRIPLGQASNTVYSASLSETVTVSESLGVQANFQPGLPETVALSESVAPQAVFNVGPSETVAVSEQVAQFVALPANLSESVGAIGESLSSQLLANVALSENPTLSEALAIVAKYNVGLSENVTASEAIAAGLLFTASLSESVTLSEALAVQLQALVGLAENPVLSEQLATQAVFNATGLAETVTLSEVLVAGLLFAANLSETVGAIGESLSVNYQAIAALSETVAASEALSIQARFTQALAESATVSEQLAVSQIFPVALAESVGAITDQLAVMMVVAANLAESVTAAEQLSAAATYTQALAETASLAEQLAVQLRAIASLGESVSSSESVDATIPTFHQFFANLVETVAVLESLSVSVIHRPPGEFFFFGYAPAPSSRTGYTPATTLSLTGYGAGPVHGAGYAHNVFNLTGYAQ